ncbi:hypothetical protein C9374_010215 [Naegleria lovaniensis]|uniref:DNA topoisomerase (ATP-hydrolyzing) n=1 Tax=Naegleria lovaniensis TaxID=51637 RepID=A0AA88KGF2_NAELO|nr:uncharacterized protein C9374_010215 [Naegleria lovaniensis]KAG2374841.1 hypothetical protein C9374_010215 [Naegleria lovaniensis]
MDETPSLNDEVPTDWNLFDIERLCQIHYILSREELIALIEAHVVEFLLQLIQEKKTLEDLLFKYKFRSEIQTEDQPTALSQTKPINVLKTASGTYSLRHGTSPKRKSHFIWLLMNNIFKLIQQGIKITQRELFYMNVMAFKDQNQCNRYLSCVGDILNVDRSVLNIICMSKGFLYSNDGSGNALVSCHHLTASTVEQIPGDFPTIDFFGKVDTILIVEKDAIFRRLVEDKIFKWVRNICIITGCGYPSIITRYILHQISSKFPQAQIYALCDFNIHGYQIVTTFKYGSVELSKHSIQQSTTLGDRIEWIGLLYDDIKDLPSFYCQSVTEQELKLLDRHQHDVKSRGGKNALQIYAELEKMKTLKFEIESLVSYRDINYLTMFVSKKISRFNIKNQSVSL